MKPRNTESVNRSGQPEEQIVIVNKYNFYVILDYTYNFSSERYLFPFFYEKCLLSYDLSIRKHFMDKDKLAKAAVCALQSSYAPKKHRKNLFIFVFSITVRLTISTFD